MMNDDLVKLFKLYPRKIPQLTEHTLSHGDPLFAAKQVGINPKWIEALLEYTPPEDYDELLDPPDPILEARQTLQAAVDQGSKNRVSYAKALFLEKYQEHASVNEAIDTQPWFDRQFFEEERMRDFDFDQRWNHAHDCAVDTLRIAAWKRGVEGVEEPQIHQGQYMYQYNPETMRNEMVTLRKYSDPMLQMLLKRFDSSFGDRMSIDQTTQVHGSMNVSLAPQILAELSNEELLTLKKVVDLQKLTAEPLPALSAPTPTDEDIIQAEVIDEHQSD